MSNDDRSKPLSRRLPSLLPLYDVVKFHTLPRSHTFFERPVGMSGSDLRVKEREDTNIYIGNQLMPGTSFYVTALAVYFVPNCDREAKPDRAQDIDDTLTVLGRGSLELRVADKIYLDIAPLAALPPPFPMYWAHDDERLERLLHGDMSASGELAPSRTLQTEVFKITPLYIPAQQYFAAIVRFKDSMALSAQGKLGVILYGQLIREIV
jgi:hypothetical protein